MKVNARNYITRAFELSRQFLFKWTVNWRFVSEDVFLSRTFSLSLLAAHIAILALFAATRWSKPAGGSISKLVRLALRESPEGHREHISRQINPEFILTAVLSANAIGMLCARSLHYQFYAWTGWATPFLLWRAGFHPILQYGLWAAQEWAWNVYPSTEMSSMVVVAVLAVTVGGIWWGTREGYVAKEPELHAHEE